MCESTQNRKEQERTVKEIETERSRKQEGRRMKKKMIASMTGALLLASAVTVGAAQPQEKTVDLSAEVASTFTLTIPAATEITFGDLKTDLAGELKVTGNVDTDEQVTVTAVVNPLHNDSHNEDIVFELKAGETAFQSAVWSETELREGLADEAAVKKIVLSVHIGQSAWDQAKAGAYAGSVTFTAALGDVTVTP